MSHRRKHRLKIKSLYVWHRYLGLGVAVFVVLLTSTGIVLNHTDSLDLDARYVSSAWLLDWYGIQAPNEALHYPLTDTAAVTQLGTQLYYRQQRLAGEYQQLQGAVSLDDFIVIAVDNDLLLLTPQGEQIERLSAHQGLPQPITRLGLDAQGLLVLATEQAHYRADVQLLNWTALDPEAPIDWRQPSPVDRATLHSLQAAFRSHILPWERVLLDLHSGRLFGTWGPWLMDLAALLITFLAVSGVLMWWKRQR